MNFNFVPVEDVLEETVLKEYKQKIEQFYLGHLVPLNTNIFIMDKIAEFPLHLFANPVDDMFLPLVYRNFYQISILTISRLVNDQGKGFLTLPRFKNWILQMTKPDYRSPFQAWLRRIKFNEETNQLLERTRDLRDSYIAHIKHNPDIPITEGLNLEELKHLRDMLNELLDALSFNVDYMMLPVSYTAINQGSTDIERILDNIARGSILLNAPEQDPFYWASLRENNSPFGEAHFQVINRYRRKFGLPDA